MIVTVYRKPVLERVTDTMGKLSSRESTWRRTRVLEAWDLDCVAVYWPRAYIDFGAGGIREFSLNTGRGLAEMVDWVLKPEDCRALRLQHAPANRRKRRELDWDATKGKEHIRPHRL